MKANYNDARDTLRTLIASGHQAYLAGGCVRDMLLGRPVNDFDITTSATPEQVQAIFKHTIPVGASFGVVKVIYGTDRELDVATFRTDGAYSDNRRPDSVAYTADVTEDVKRRDFTINAMLMDQNEQVIDYVGGQIDLKCRLIKTVGDPAARFSEDALRMMRAVRFAAKLGFDIDKETEAAIESYSASINNVSKERITEELTKIMSSGRADIGFWLLKRTGLWSRYFVNGPDNTDCLNAMYGLHQIRPGDSFVLAWATVIANCYDSTQKALTEKLVLTNAQKQQLNSLQARAISMSEFLYRDLPSQRKMMFWEDRDSIIKFLQINQQVRKLEWGVRNVDTVQTIFDRMAEVRAMGWPGPLITGDDLLEWGWIQHKVFGDMLDAVREAQLSGELKSKDEVSAFIISKFPAAPRRKSDGTIQDGMTRRGFIAVCKKCGSTMSFTAERTPTGKVIWDSVQNEVGVSHMKHNYGMFACCSNCYTRKMKSKFVEAVE